MKENKGYLQRYAMLFGTYMGGFWILKFILFPLGMTIPFLLLLFMVLTLCVPFMGYYYARAYRNHICGGSINFFHAWLFTTLMYMFAALLASVAHYIYFKYIDQGLVFSYYDGLVNTISRMQGMEKYVELQKESLAVMRSMTSIEITMQFMSMDVFYCSILAIPTALFVMKRRKEENNKEE